MTVVEFQNQIIAINGQLNDMIHNCINMNVSTKEAYDRNIEVNCQVLHSALVNSLEQLTEEQKAKISSIFMSQVANLAKKLFAATSKEYQAQYKQYVKSSKAKKDATID